METSAGKMRRIDPGWNKFLRKFGLGLLGGLQLPTKEIACNRNVLVDIYGTLGPFKNQRSTQAVKGDEI